MIYDKIKIVDFKARPDRIVYILAEGKKKFVVLNNDSDMTERSEIHSKETRRHTTVARLIDNEIKEKLCPGLRGPGGTLFKGLAYPRFYDADGGAKVVKEIRDKKLSENYPELYEAAGRIEKGYDSYTTINEMPIDDNPSHIAKLFTPTLLEQLEHYLVPDDMTAKIREYVKTHGRL